MEQYNSPFYTEIVPPRRPFPTLPLYFILNWRQDTALLGGHQRKVDTTGCYMFSIIIKNDSPLWPCCDSSCSRRCTWRSRWPVWFQVTPQKRPPLCWCSVDSADAKSSPYLAFLGSPSHVGRGKGISSQCSPPRTRAYCPQTPDSWGSLLRPAGDHDRSFTSVLLVLLVFNRLESWGYGKWTVLTVCLW